MLNTGSFITQSRVAKVFKSSDLQTFKPSSLQASSSFFKTVGLHSSFLKSVESSSLLQSCLFQVFGSPSSLQVLRSSSLQAFKPSSLFKLLLSSFSQASSSLSSLQIFSSLQVFLKSSSLLQVFKSSGLQAFKPSSL